MRKMPDGSVVTRAHLAAASHLHGGAVPDHVMSLDDPRELGDFMIRLYKMTGVPDYLDEAIAATQNAVRSEPGHGDPVLFSSLVERLRDRYEINNDSKDLESMIWATRRAILFTADADQAKGAERLHDLGTYHMRHLAIHHSQDELEQAILAFYCACQLAANDRESQFRPFFFFHYGVALTERFKRTGQRQDLDAGISAQRHAVSIMPDDHHRKPSTLVELAQRLFSRFKLMGTQFDFDEAAAIYGRAIVLTPDDGPQKLSLLDNLGKRLAAHVAETGHRGHMDAAIFVRGSTLR